METRLSNPQVFSYEKHALLVCLVCVEFAATVRFK